MDMFLGAVFLKEPPLKLISKNGYEAIVPPAKVGGGVLSQPPLLEKASVKIFFCTSGLGHRDNLIEKSGRNEEWRNDMLHY